MIFTKKSEVNKTFDFLFLDIIYYNLLLFVRLLEPNSVLMSDIWTKTGKKVVKYKCRLTDTLN